MKRTVMVAILIMAWAASGGAAKSKWQKAAKKGDAVAQYMLGWAYYNGTDEKKDYALAFEWWTKAAEQGNAEAQCKLGDCYFKGDGVEQDEAKGWYWYERAASKGNNTARMRIAQRQEEKEAQEMAAAMKGALN